MFICSFLPGRKGNNPIDRVRCVALAALHADHEAWDDVAVATSAEIKFEFLSSAT